MQFNLNCFLKNLILEPIISTLSYTLSKSNFISLDGISKQNLRGLPLT